MLLKNALRIRSKHSVSISGAIIPIVLSGHGQTSALSAESPVSLQPTASRATKAALAPGQDDDITVLTLTYAPPEVAHA